MAEAALLGVAKSVLGQLASPASNEFLLVWNFDKDLKSLEQTIQTISDVLLDAEQRESKEHLVKGWLSRLKEVLYDADDLFDAVAARSLRKKFMSGNTFRKEVLLFFSKSNQLFFVVRTAHDVKDIRERLDGISKDMSQFRFISERIEENPTTRETHSFVKLEDVIGRDREKEDVIALLLPKQEACQRNLSAVSVIGFGGLGKTTLAKLVYNDERVQRGFDLCLWACVNYFEDLKKVVVAILTSVPGSKPQDNSLDQLQKELRKNIEGKKYFLVLDDVWEEDPSNWLHLETILDCGKSGSKILATTRSTRVAQCLNAIKPYYQLQNLSKESAWDLFAKSAFEEGELSNDSELVRLGEQIVRKCGNVPLALVTVGRRLRFEKNDKKLWLSVVDNQLSDLFADNKDDHIMNALMISYNGLPPALKHCFAYCSIFPKDYKFDKDELVRLWIAQSFVEPRVKKSLEEVGDAYFFHMVDRCFFQEVEMYLEKGCVRYRCKMHDLLHDLAIRVAGMESQGGGSSLRHISIKCDKDFSFDPFVLSPRSKTIRTLLLDSAKHLKTSSLNSLLGSFKMVRALQLPSLDVAMLPDSFGGLIHLRYLDLSGNGKLLKIPNSVCKLHHLQTLSLKNCYSLVELPSNLRKLGSLRHLFLDGCDGLDSLPSGLAEITTLVSLDRLIVHPSYGGLRYLSFLDDLCGLVQIELPVKGWPNCKEDARKSNMLKKHELNGMIIDYSITDGGHETTMEETNGVLEALQPHEALQYFDIRRYAGDKLASWVFSLSNLKELHLYDCTKLEYLYHEKVKTESVLPFLEVLELDSLPNLKGWWREVAVPGDNNALLMSRVSKVSIECCRNLVEGMPIFTGMTDLCLDRVNGKLVGKLLSTTPNPGYDYYNLERISLESIEELSCLPKGSLKCLTALKSLEIIHCEELRWVSSSGLAYLTSMEELEISHCRNVKLEDKEEDDEKEEINTSGLMRMPWKALQRLRRLVVPWQTHLQEGLQFLTALEELSISYYESRQEEADKGSDGMLYCCFPKPFQNLRFLKDLSFDECGELSMSWTMLASMNLQELSFHNVKKVVNVDETKPEQQTQSNSLIRLTIQGDGSWIHDIPWQLLQSLRTIQLSFLTSVKKIPDGFLHLTSLQQLSIIGCEQEVGERCKPETGEDWRLISHIPTIYIRMRLVNTGGLIYQSKRAVVKKGYQLTLLNLQSSINLVRLDQSVLKDPCLWMHKVLSIDLLRVQLPPPAKDNIFNEQQWETTILHICFLEFVYIHGFDLPS